MTKLTQDQIERLQELIHYWVNQNRIPGQTDEKYAIQDGIFMLLEVLGIDDDGIQSALDEVL